MREYTKLITPVVFIIFNRPETTKIVFDSIRQAKPICLYVIADGPRNSNEEKLCLQTRAIVENVDWECDIYTNYSQTNLGCKRRISTGLDWVFNRTEEAIVLEDDCLPNSTFFMYCQQLLEKYQNDERIMSISGDNFNKDNSIRVYSYYFSKYPHVWGWATWKRAWQSYDVTIDLWRKPEVQKAILSHFTTSQEQKFWFEIFNLLINDQLDTWDYQWAFNCFINNGLSINPSVNLVSNIGFNPNATHTKSESNLANLSTVEITFPLNHPLCVLSDKFQDEFVEKIFFYKPNRFQRIFSRFKGKFGAKVNEQL